MFKKFGWASLEMFWGLINSFLIIVIIGSLFGVGILLRSGNAIAPSRTITVSGEGKTKVVPDLATVTFSVVTQGDKPADIQKVNTAKMNKAIDFLKQQGVAEKDIQTTGYNLYPRYRYDKDSGEQSIVGYELNQTVTVKIRELDKAGALIGGITDAGINQINGPQLSVEDPEAQRNKAREEAFKQAREKAEAMAEFNGVRISRVISFSESFGGYPVPMYAAYGKGGDSVSSAPYIQPGEQETTVQVSVTYEIR